MLSRYPSSTFIANSDSEVAPDEVRFRGTNGVIVGLRTGKKLKRVLCDLHADGDEDNAAWEGYLDTDEDLIPSARTKEDAPPIVRSGGIVGDRLVADVLKDLIEDPALAIHADYLAAPALPNVTGYEESLERKLPETLQDGGTGVNLTTHVERETDEIRRQVLTLPELPKMEPFSDPMDSLES